MRDSILFVAIPLNIKAPLHLVTTLLLTAPCILHLVTTLPSFFFFFYRVTRGILCNSGPDAVSVCILQIVVAIHWRSSGLISGEADLRSQDKISSEDQLLCFAAPHF